LGLQNVVGLRHVETGDAMDVCDKGKKVKKDPRVRPPWWEPASTVMERGEGESSDNGPVPAAHVF